MPSRGKADDHIPLAHTFLSSSALRRHVHSPVVLIYMSHYSDECYYCSPKHMLKVYYGTKYGLGKNLDCLSVKQ